MFFGCEIRKKNSQIILRCFSGEYYYAVSVLYVVSIEVRIMFRAKRISLPFRLKGIFDSHRNLLPSFSANQINSLN